MEGSPRARPTTRARLESGSRTRQPSLLGPDCARHQAQAESPARPGVFNHGGSAAGVSRHNLPAAAFVSALPFWGQPTQGVWFPACRSSWRAQSIVLDRLGVPSLPLGSRGTRAISWAAWGPPEETPRWFGERRQGPPTGDLLPVLTPSVPVVLIQTPPRPTGAEQGEGHQITPLKRRDINNPITPEQDKSALP